MRTELRIVRRGAGVASVEFILVLPIILAVFILMMHALRIGHLAEELAVETRSIAWREALHERVCALGGTARNARRSDHLLVTLCGEPSNDASDVFLGQMRAAGNPQWSGSDAMTAVLASTAPSGVQTSSGTLYQLRSATGISATDLAGVRSMQQLRGLAANALGVQPLITEYGLDVRDAWLREDLQIGFDNYYDNRFRKHILYPDFFPCATGDERSAEKPSTCGGHDVPDYEYDGDPIETEEPDLRGLCEDGCRDDATSLDPLERAREINACIVRECSDL